jgi:competence protein ComFC
MPAHLAYRLYQSIWMAVDWLYPPSCGGCEQRGVRWCENCQQSTRTVKAPVCPVCGQMQLQAEVCDRCRLSPPHYVALRSWALFGGSVRNALHRLKYRRDIGLGDALSHPLIDYVSQFDWPLNLIVPVPLGQKRMTERGYNQAALLARPLALALGISHQPGALWRARETRSQVGLSAALRKENVADAFRANARLVTGRSILVVDDVTTTGSTLDACAAALKAAGAHAVYGLTLARAPLGGQDAA